LVIGSALGKCLRQYYRFLLYAMGLIPKILLRKGVLGRLKKYQTLSQIPCQNNQPRSAAGLVVYSPSSLSAVASSSSAFSR
jgi:hypothetical protein